jgi:uncharacterized protein (DUF2141 family)
MSSRMTRVGARCLGLVLAGAVALVSGAAGADEPSDVNIIEFLTYVRGSSGVVRCGLFEQGGWLKKPVQPATVKINGDRALCVFQRVREGTYGISAFHDANGNGKLDMNLLGMPAEDYCASRNARAALGPPRFDDAKFDYHGATLRLEARMK